MDITIFQTAINAAMSPVMIGFYLAAMCFCLGFIPAVGARCITITLDSDPLDGD